MIFGKTKMELKVGIFVFVGLVILSMFILSLGGFKTWASRYNVIFVYNFINGVKLGAPVRFAGLDVGEVKDIRFYFSPEQAKTKIEVICSLKKEVKIPVDSSVWVNTLGLLGEKYIEIIPGKNYANCLAGNQKLDGVDPLAMHDVVRMAKAITENLNESITKLNNKEGTVGKLLYDDALYKDIEAAMRNKDGTIGRLFYDDALYQEMESLIQDIRRHPWKLFWKTKEKPEKKK